MKCKLVMIVFFAADAAGALPQAELRLTHGVASGDVTPDSAVIWARASGPATLETEYDTDASFSHPQRGPSVPVGAETDFAGQVVVTRLAPATRYHYRVRARSGGVASAPEAGSFLTPPQPKEARDVRFLWAGDLGGQGFCRKPDAGYTIFDAMAALEPDFTLFSGDMIYADSACPSPPNLPGSDFVSRTLEQFRQRWRYNREDGHHRAFLARSSIVTQWDDHEVTNDFAGSTEPLMPLGRQAYFEYHPIRRPARERYRLYRKLRWGKELELFVLDNRQYRDTNSKPDSDTKTMLGRAQYDWLIDSLAHSDAVWKIVATSVPLSIPTGTEAAVRGRDSWANGSTASNPAGNATGWERELMALMRAIRGRRIMNLIWITTDVHHAQFARLDPFGDGSLTTYELISGPLSAVMSKPGELDTTLHPTRLYAEGEFANFGRISIAAATHRLSVEIRTSPEAARAAGRPEVRRTLELDAVLRR